MIVEVVLVVGILYMLFGAVYYSSMKDVETNSPYECGFDVQSLTRETFSYRFFLISILFLIFDVEISLMLPVPFLVSEIGGLWVFMVFVVILIVGLLYEYYYGSLDWMDSLA